MADWYPHYMGDYARDTAHLSLVEHGAYRQLLDYCYSMEGPLPADVQQVFRICRAQKESEKAAVLVILNSFFDLKTDGYRNGRVDAQLLKMQAKSGKSRAAAKAKWHANASAVASAPAMPPEPEPDPYPKKDLKTKTMPATQASHPLFKIWQEDRGQLPEVIELTANRLSKCRARMTNHASDPERFLAKFREAVRKATQNAFLTGSDGGWKASFDWFIANDENYLKVLEGKYDGGGNGRTGSTQHSTDARKERAEQRHQDTQQVIASVLGHGSRLAERLRENIPK